MANWKTYSFQGFQVIEKVAAIFEVGPPLPPTLPFASFTVKVLERRDGSFAAHLNVAVRSPKGSAEAEAGLGQTVDEALEDALDSFWKAVQEYGATRPEDFIWLDSAEWRDLG